MSVRPQTKDKPAAASFQWDDPFLLDEQLTEDERMIRDTARAYAQDKLLPRIVKAYLEEKCERELRRLWPGGARDRARRFWLSLDELGAVVAGDVSDLRLWRREPAQEIPAEARHRRMGRLLRPDRAGRRFRSQRHEDPRRKGVRRLQADRQQYVDF